MATRRLLMEYQKIMHEKKLLLQAGHCSTAILRKRMKQEQPCHDLEERAFFCNICFNVHVAGNAAKIGQHIRTTRSCMHGSWMATVL